MEMTTCGQNENISANQQARLTKDPLPVTSQLVPRALVVWAQMGFAAQATHWSAVDLHKTVMTSICEALNRLLRGASGGDN